MAKIKKAKKEPKKETKTIKVDKKIEPKTLKKVSHGNLVSVDYTGSLDNGEVFDNSQRNGPIQFIVGQGQVIKGFEDAVLGMKLNDEKTVKIKKENAYGDINPALRQKVPLTKLPEEVRGNVKAGGFLILQAPTGQQIPVRVMAVEKDVITVDLNHPLAGKDLTFKIKIVNISEPHAHVHDENCGHNH